MSAQKFYADLTASFTWPNGAIGYRPSNRPFDCLGPYARVVNCPVYGLKARYTCYATGYADTVFSVPACTRIKGKYISGYFALVADGIQFHPMRKHHAFLGITP